MEPLFRPDDEASGQRRSLWPLLFVLSVVALACSPGVAEDEVIARAKRDWGCSDVSATYNGRPSRSSETEYWVAEGCGRMGAYVCISEVDGFDCRPR